jgi:hypothetical protein
MVEVITVSEPRVIEIGAISDNEPILAFDIGDRSILYLQGQWLRDEATYGSPARPGDPLEEFFNGLPAPYSFPSRAFVVTRLPNSGRVLGIRVNGQYVAPEKSVEALRPEYELGDSEIFDGSVDDLAEILAKKHAQREAGT